MQLLWLPRTAKSEKGGQHRNIPKVSENMLANVFSEILFFMAGDFGLSEKAQ